MNKVCSTINSTIAQHFFDFSYNFIILMFFASFNGEAFINQNKKLISIKDNMITK